MNNLVFYTDDDKYEVQAEMQECTPVSGEEDPRNGVFRVKEKPCYVKVFFNSEFTMDEVRKLYEILLRHELIELPNGIDDTVADDFTAVNGNIKNAVWEIRHKDFKKAFECCVDMVNWFGSNSLGVMISDEPSDTFRQWLNSRQEHAS